MGRKSDNAASLSLVGLIIQKTIPAYDDRVAGIALLTIS